MTNNGFFNNIEVNEKNREVISELESIAISDNSEQIYLINSPLGEKKYSYDYQDSVIVILSPRRKIIFLDLGNNEADFEKYCKYFIEDLGSISDKFNYKEYIGRPDDWKEELITQEGLMEEVSGWKILKSKRERKDKTILSILEQNKLSSDLYRKAELLITLLVGSINDVSKKGVQEPESLLEKVKQKIVLFDADQTRFIYEKKNKKIIHIQGLAGTGKTELLLHKLKDVYTSSDTSKIYLTCNNVALARDLDNRVPNFFNFHKVQKQIVKNERLWITNAWGSNSDENSGLYRYICAFYKIPFLNLRQSGGSFEKAIGYAIEEISKIEKDQFKYALDYILVDESQDFTKNFFELCSIVAREEVYVAGDLFQDIFDTYIDDREITPDYILNKCYRTDPRTLMFAQSIGMGLFEEPHLNWLTDKGWKDLGYIMEKNESTVNLSRYPIRRFEELDIDEYESMQVKVIETDFVGDTVKIIEKLRNENSTLAADDICILYLDDNYDELCDLGNKLEFTIASELEMKVTKGYLTRSKIPKTIYISNRNHAKGLEFPFVICLTNRIKSNYKYRNSLYTMLTRSFLQSFLLVKDPHGLDKHLEGLSIIQEKNIIKTTQPKKEELSKMKDTIIHYNQRKKGSYRDFIREILVEIGIDEKLNKALDFLFASKYKNSFEYDEVKRFLEINKHNF